MTKVLILGGTRFIGRNLVEKLSEKEGYEITLFNRQLTEPGLFPGIHRLKGDRETHAIRQIAGVHWDYVIDLSCYYPRVLQDTLHAISSLGTYVFISTCSVYDHANDQTPLRNEQAGTLSCTPAQGLDRSPETYGNRKAECERILRDSGIAHVIMRPALVFGKYDPTDRFYYWLYQVKHHDPLLLPDKGERRFSITYVGDLVEAIIQTVDGKPASGIYNVITAPQTSIRQIVELAGECLQKEFSTLHAPGDFLQANNIAPWADMPLWLDADHFTYQNQRLRTELEISVTGLKDAITDTIRYFDSIHWQEPKYGITENQRQELIKQLL